MVTAKEIFRTYLLLAKYPVGRRGKSGFYPNEIKSIAMESGAHYASKVASLTAQS